MLCLTVQCDVMGLLGEGVQRVDTVDVCVRILHGLNMCAFIKARMKCRMNIGWCSELWGRVEKCVL